MNKRRKLILVLGAGALAPQLARSQQSPLPVIGFLGNNLSNKRSPDAFRKGLSEAGYVEATLALNSTTVDE